MYAVGLQVDFEDPVTLPQYAWKPLAIKDAVEAFGSVLWLDAGSTVTAPLEPAFEALHRDGHFLVQGQDMDCSQCVPLHPVAERRRLPSRASALPHEMQAAGLHEMLLCVTGLSR